MQTTDMNSWTEANGPTWLGRALRRSRKTAPRAPTGPWLTVRQAAQRAQCGIKTIYREVAAGRLRAAKVGGRRELRIRVEWVDEWLHKAATVQ
jgi:excisionase family DNA binding protein